LSDLRERILAATYACVARWGIAKTTVEDVAREASLSRATLYRTFPGGREELIREAVAWEVDNFFARLADSVASAEGFEEVVEVALLHAHRQVREHEVLQKLLVTEADRLVPTITMETGRLIPLIEAFVSPYLERERLRPGVTVPDAAAYVARMVTSHINAQGRWDLEDPDQIRDLVRTEILAGIVDGGAP
jgi:AcrR family transcriptional regulator